MSELLNELEADERAASKKKKKKDRLKQNQKMRKEGVPEEVKAQEPDIAAQSKYGATRKPELQTVQGACELLGVKHPRFLLCKYVFPIAYSVSATKSNSNCWPFLKRSDMYVNVLKNIKIYRHVKY